MDQVVKNISSSLLKKRLNLTTGIKLIQNALGKLAQIKAVV